ncbi:MAG: PD-(D/E)XK nuclease domain-containing protein, partial [Lachnospiraceae bacterium]|nr:PD-(D/E)XK nuclease domain-containing protein [Lachnospiraceae bacterium]
GGMGTHLVKSNRESGMGRPDIALVPRRIRGTTVILIECKAADSVGGLEAAADEALAQIDRKKYEEGWRAEGYQNFIHYGFAFYKKDVLVKTV